jgi:peptidoglycan-associated lipoprotein
MKTKKRRSIMPIFIVLCLVPFLFSCAKKQVQTEEEVSPAETTQEVKEAEPSTADDEAAREAEKERLRLERLRGEIQVFESEHIYFDFDKSDLKPEAQAVLKSKAEWLKANPGYAVRIEGHCDERGTTEYNLALGERRAEAAKKFLTALGISNDRLRTISYGEENPADPGHNEEAWAKNRRDEFKLLE